MKEFLRIQWKKRKFRQFLLIHLLLIVGVVTVPFDRWFLYDLLIFRLLTWPYSSCIQHLCFNHRYVVFKNNIIKILSLFYVMLVDHYKFSDVKSYHITHHKLWLTDKEPTNHEVTQGFLSYYMGITDPIAIEQLGVERDAILEFLNKYFYPIKIALIVIFLVLFGWKMYVHFVIVQQFLVYFTLKIHDRIHHYKPATAKDYWFLYIVYGPDAWHIEHHRTYKEMIVWRLKYIDPQYIYCKLFFKSNPNPN